MAYKFNPDKKHKLDNEDRKKEMPPKDTLKNMLLTKQDNFLDVGAGIGYFSIAASEIIGENKKVYAVDTSEEMLEELKRRIQKENINNILPMNGNKYNTDIENNSVSYIFMSNVLHEVEDKELFLKNYLEKLKPDGKIGIVEFKKKEISKGPPVEHKISINQLRNYYKRLNLEIIKEVDINDFQYGVVGKKK